MRKAKDAAEPDHTACAKYAELLLKRGSVGKHADLPDGLAADIAAYGGDGEDTNAS